jgi:phage baseplate assembly protein W
MTLDTENEVDLIEKKLILGADLELAESEMGADLYSSPLGDLRVISGDMNLAQAILHRLRTIKGELLDIGHPNYGSNLYDLVGEPNNQTTRDRLKAMIRTTILQEPRIKEIVKIEIRSRLDNSNRALSENYDSIKKDLSSNNKQQTISSNSKSYEENRRLLATSVDVNVTVIPIESTVPLNIVFPFYFELV